MLQITEWKKMKVYIKKTRSLLPLEAVPYLAILQSGFLQAWRSAHTEQYVEFRLKLLTNIITQWNNNSHKDACVHPYETSVASYTSLQFKKRFYGSIEQCPFEGCKHYYSCCSRMHFLTLAMLFHPYRLTAL